MTQRRTAFAGRVAALFAVTAIGMVGFLFAHQARPSLRFEIGSMDRDYLEGEEQFYSRIRMDGPIRYDDETVEVIDFYGRLTRSRASFTLPYHALRSPVELRIRCHRFGLDGTVALTVNGRHLHDFLFTERSYPWGGIRTVVPQEVAELGPLRIELEVRDGEPSNGRYPEDFGVGVDWLVVEPLSEGVLLLPSLQQLGAAVFFPLAVWAFVIGTGSSFRRSILVLAATFVLVAALTALAPQYSGMAWRRLWVVLPLGYLVHLSLKALFTERYEPRLESADTAFLSRLFVGAALAHSVLIFFPNHAPPDLWNHIPQIEWLETLELTPKNLYRYSTSSDVFDDDHVRPHFGTDYGAPYPPYFYALTFAISRLHDDPRFLVEFLPVLFGAAMLVLTFLIAKAIWRDGLLSRLAAALLAVEIALWHHAHRVHAPGILGELFLLSWLLFLVLQYRELGTRRGMVLLAALSAATALSYPATLVQLCLVTATVTVLLLASPDSEDRALAGRIVVGVSAGLAASFVLYYAPYAVEAVARRGVLLDRAEYDPPATFFFLRNQMRDTVRILRNGYVLYVFLSIGGWVLLRRSGAERFHRLLLVGAGLTYVIMLVLKDPVFLPWIFLHAKEDLFYAPTACLLSALALSRLWRAWAGGRLVVIGVTLLFVALAVRDQYLNVDTLHDRPVQGVAEDDPVAAASRYRPALP